MAKAKAVTAKSDPAIFAKALLGPSLRHGLAARSILSAMTGSEPPEIEHFAECMVERAKKIEGGDVQAIGYALAVQAQTLDLLFAEFARRAALNMGEYINASERYARLALKAQSNARATLETIAKLHQPREQTVRHVHVNQGGQAVVAEHFHQHGGSGDNGESDGQSHAPRLQGAAGPSAALPSPDPLGNGMPIPSRERQAAVPDARGY